MMTKEIEQYLREVNDELALQNVKGEICLYGGAVMCLVFKARPATKDVDAIFEPVKFIRNAITKIAERHDLRQDWLNLAVKMFVVEHEKKILFDFPNLKVFVPTADYLLAMKVLAARADTEDVSDIKFLSNKLKLSELTQITEVVRKYYPNKAIKPETEFLLEEILKK
ncbi:DUF6036 family nucleotidyltransferase [soil metagenome]|nr:hypothetical protein [Acidobacteriota bacterium]